MPQRHGYQRLKLDVDNIVDLYVVERLSVLEIAARLGCSRVTIDRRLTSRGVERRSPREQQLIAASRRTPEQRFAMARPSHDAIRGKRRSFSELMRRARTKQGAAPTAYEQAVLHSLSIVGLAPVPQMAIGKFNIDAALPTKLLAIEVDSGNWHSTARKLATDIRKTSYLVAVGWRVIRVDPTMRTSAMRRLKPDKDLVTWAQTISRLPSPSRENRMLWGRYQTALADGRYDQLARPTTLAKT